MTVIIVKDIAFFFILYIIEDVKTTSVIETRPCFDFFKDLKIIETELLKNKYAPATVKNKIINGVNKAIVNS